MLVGILVGLLFGFLGEKRNRTFSACQSFVDFHSGIYVVVSIHYDHIQSHKARADLRGALQVAPGSDSEILERGIHLWYLIGKRGSTLSLNI